MMTDRRTGAQRQARPWRRGVGALLALGLLAGACGGGDDDEAAPEPDDATGAESDISEQGDPVEGGSITVGLEAETNAWLPGEANFGNPGINVAFAIFDPLMKRTPDGGVEPYLAESMEANEDATAWTLTLRPGITFHDETPLDGAALKTIFDEYLTADTSNLAGTLAIVESLEVVDELTVTYNLTEANAAFPDVLADAPGWPFSPTAAAQFGEDAGANPVGTGPFVFESWQRDNQLVVVKNDSYWQEGLPHLDQITFRPIPDEDTRLDSLSTGDIDALQSLRQSAVADAREIDGVDSYEFLGNNGGGSIINTALPPFDDVRVRRSLALALDQDALIEVLGGTGLTPPQTQYFSPDSPFYSEEAEAAWPNNDPAEATELLNDYVDDPERSDGEAPGTAISFEYDCPPDPSLNELSQLYQALWQAVGYEVSLRQVEQATHIDEALAGDYQMKCFRFGEEGDPYFTFDDAFTEGPLNFTRFQSPEIEEQLALLRTETDAEARVPAVEAIGLLLAEEVPNTFTGGTLTVIAVREAVKNIDGWVFPDGVEGNGTPGATVMWGHVWLAE